MDSRLRLSQVREALYSLIAPDEPTNPMVVKVINEVCERYINNGAWKGQVMTLVFDSADKFITLPYNYASVMAGTYLRCPFPIFTQFHKYVVNGPGNVDEAFKWCGILIDMGDGFVTQRDIESGETGVLRVYSSAADDTEVVRVYGQDQDGQVIYDADGNEGEEVTLVAPFATTTNSYSKVTGFYKPYTKARLRLFVVPASGTEIQLAEYQPNETEISYHRYQTGEIQPVQEQANAIKLICRRRFVPVNAETDWVYPGNMAALRNGVQAWMSENASDYNSASAALSRGLYFLNQEAKTYRGGGRPTVNVENFGIWDSYYDTIT